jgi:hypothetical protein
MPCCALPELTARAVPPQKNGNFKEALKAMLKQASNAMSTHELKVGVGRGSGMYLCASLCGAHCPHAHQEVESSLVALRNQKLKEERDAQQKAAKKSALRPLVPHTHAPARIGSALLSPLSLTRSGIHPGHPQLLPRPSPS